MTADAWAHVFDFLVPEEPSTAQQINDLMFTRDSIQVLYTTLIMRARRLKKALKDIYPNLTHFPRIIADSTSVTSGIAAYFYKKYRLNFKAITVMQKQDFAILTKKLEDNFSPARGQFPSSLDYQPSISAREKILDLLVTECVKIDCLEQNTDASKKLSLSTRRISPTLIAWLHQKHADITHLEINRTGLKRIPKQLLPGFTSLRILDLSRNELTEVPPTIKNLEQLEELIIEYNPINDQNFSSLLFSTGLGKLHTVKLKHTGSLMLDALNKIREQTQEADTNWKYNAEGFTIKRLVQSGAKRGKYG